LRFPVAIVAVVGVLMSGAAGAAGVQEMHASASGYFVSQRTMFVVSEPAPADRLQIVIKVEAVVPRVVPGEDLSSAISLPLVPSDVFASSSLPSLGLSGAVKDDDDDDDGDDDGKDKDEMVPAKISGDPVKTKKVYLTVRFDLDQKTLKGGMRKELDVFLATLQGAKEVKVTGYTCNLGTQKHNDALAKARAHQVTEYLVSHGIPATIIETNGLGKCCYVSRKREENRRAEVESLVPDVDSTTTNLPAVGESEKE